MRPIVLTMTAVVIAAAASPSPASADVDVCAQATPVALFEALKSSPDFYRRVASPASLADDVQCSAPFAHAGTAGTVQPTGVLFRWEDSRWAVLDIGSAIHCAQYGVTAEDDLEGCVV